MSLGFCNPIHATGTRHCVGRCGRMGSRWPLHNSFLSSRDRFYQHRHHPAFRLFVALATRDRQHDQDDRSKLDAEIVAIALPTLATLAADPVASLVDTAWLGRLGTDQLAGVGVALSIYSSVTRLLNAPLLSVTTTAVARALGRTEAGEASDEEIGRAASSALLVALLVGGIEAALLLSALVWGLGIWGAPEDSPLHPAAVAYLTWRAIGAPSYALLLACQGVWRGLGDTKAPLYATVGVNAVNVALCPALIFGAGWGVKGAAIATVAAEAGGCAWLLWKLNRQHPLRTAGVSAVADTLTLLRPTGLLVLRTAALSAPLALSSALAARTDGPHAAAHQICFQVWLASSLMADALAVAAQSLLARRLAAKQPAAGQEVVRETVKLAIILGLLLGGTLLAAGEPMLRLFTSDPDTLAAAQPLLPLVAISQPINALAFVWDGVLYGADGFSYGAKAMAACAVPTVAVMLLGQELGWDSKGQLFAIWGGLLTINMLRSGSIWVPYSRRWRPFHGLKSAVGASGGSGGDGSGGCSGSDSRNGS